ncbi:coproporphyrinogen III oxidase [Niallia circulans]|uniref:coproporphyrinogen III oxidase n=1 Tax=Niallia circulans TaxID=1397 RepID=UPI000BA6BFEF|nr:coproporphyrinogen III oxidase [Niallia circulans]PAD88858.1 coproporphyrinogen III oxidase [Niallia circulans]
MKQIYIKGLTDERYIRPLEHIGNLFFEDTKVLYREPEEKADLHVEFETEIIGHEFIVKGKLKELKEETICNGHADLSQLTDKEIFKQMKKAISKSYLLMLQEYTGMVQKWGILTGIRPTKLLHRHMQKQTPIEEAHQSLREEYLMSDEKIELMQKIIDRQLAVIPDLYDLKKEVSIYIGIPFCPTKCAYCTFPAYAINGRQGSVSSFLGGLHYEMEKIGDWLKEKNINITTVYYGGGTPTSISAEEMDMLYERMHDSFPKVENIREITVEAGRPDTITPDKLKVLKKYNIDRISINPQSYTQQTLKAIGRHHTVEETIDKYHLARKHGMNNINMDLIIGLPGEGVEEFQYSLDKTEELMPESLTVHTLSFKRASEMTRNKSRYKVADREEIQEMMKMAEEWTEKHDYVPYYLYRQKNILGNLENVGYSKKNQESIYNIMMMEELQTVIGVGCGASSKFIHPVTGKITQFSNPKHPKTYNESFVEYTDKKIALLNEHFSLEASK